MSSFRRAVTLPVTGACSLLGINAVLAQDAPPRPPVTLEEVVVTAQKREEKLIDVPIAITAISNEALRNSGAAQLADFLESAPGVGIVDDQSGTQTIQIRGISSLFGNATVGYYLDELPFTYIGNTQVPDVRTYDLERIEILRGPQGTLYGDGSIGGTIRILTKEPSLTAFEGGVDLDGSKITDGDSNYAIKGMLNVPLKEGVAALRLVGSHEDLGGWVDNAISGEEDQNGREVDTFRGKFRWKPNENLDLVLSAWHMKEDAVGTSESLPDRSTPTDPDGVVTEYDLYSATIRYHFNAFDLVSATSYMDYANDLTSPFPFTIFEDQNLLTEELRLTSNAEGNFRWTAGVFYRDIDRRTLVDFPTFGFGQDLSFESQSWAVFGETTWSFLDKRLELTLGARYFEDDVSFFDADQSGLAIIQSQYPEFTGTVAPKFDTFNPRVNLKYDIADDWMMYVNAAKGFRTGQAQPAISLLFATFAGVRIPLGIDPEELWSFEVGTKRSFMDGRASIEGAVYYNDWKDIQTQVIVATVPLRVAALTNGGKARSIGVEAALTLQPTERLLVQLAGSVTDAKYSEDIPGTPVLDGDRIGNVPKTQLSASALYRWPLTTAMNGFVRGALQYTSDRVDIASAFQPSESMTTADLRLGLEGERWGAYVYADNLTDEDAAIDATPLGPSVLATRFRPRTFGLNLRYDFR